MNSGATDNAVHKGASGWGRFCRHSGMISLEGQRRISATCVAVGGLGGIGGAVTMMLAKAGFGKLYLCDFDRYEEANTVEQMFAASDTIGKDKATVAKAEALRHGPECQVFATNEPIRTQQDADRLVAHADYVVSGVDNAIARLLLARAAEARGLPFIVPANVGWSVFFSYRSPDSPPYEHRFKSLPLPTSADGRFDLTDPRTIEVIEAHWDIWLALLGNYDRSVTQSILLGQLRSYPYMAAPAFFAASLAVNHLSRVVALAGDAVVPPGRFAFDMLNWRPWDWETIMLRSSKALALFINGGRAELASNWEKTVGP